MKHVKNFQTFLGEDTEMPATKEKQNCLSEELCSKIEEIMEMAKNEAKNWHADENAEHTAESWAGECDSYMKECMEGLMEECKAMAGPAQPNVN
jgi:hypothetical protein